MALTGSVLLVQGGIDVLTLFLFLMAASRMYDPMQGALPPCIRPERADTVSYTHLDVYKRQALTGSVLLVQGSIDVLTLFLFLMAASRMYDPMQGALQLSLIHI